MEARKAFRTCINKILSIEGEDTVELRWSLCYNENVYCSYWPQRKEYILNFLQTLKKNIPHCLWRYLQNVMFFFVNFCIGRLMQSRKWVFPHLLGDYWYICLQQIICCDLCETSRCQFVIWFSSPVGGRRSFLLSGRKWNDNQLGPSPTLNSSSGYCGHFPNCGFIFYILMSTQNVSIL